MRHASARKSRVSIVSGNVIFAKLPAILSAREQRETEKTFVYVFNSRNRIVTEGWKELSDWIVYNTVTNLCGMKATDSGTHTRIGAGMFPCYYSWVGHYNISFYVSVQYWTPMTLRSKSQFYCRNLWKRVVLISLIFS